MSYKHPLIKELKGHTLTITKELQEGSEINDTSKNVVLWCATVEKIFQTGCITHSWNVLENLAKLMSAGHIDTKSFNYLSSVENVRASQLVKTPMGKLRLLIRSCLAYKCLHVPVEIMVRSHNTLTSSWYYHKTSIIGNEILGEILLFLDVTPVLPSCAFIEFVPCSSLGMTVTFIDDNALVIDVEDSSVAAEDSQIQVGDILHELNGQLLTSEHKGKLRGLMLKSKKKPVVVRILKFHNLQNGDIFPPIEQLLRKAKIYTYPNKTLMSNKDKSDENLFSKNNIVETDVYYVGSVPVGGKGHVEIIEQVISQLVQSIKNSDFVRVYIEYHELGLKVFNKLTGEMLTGNSFMEISSCGQTKSHPNYFGYLAGNDLCNLATQFTCHVFQSNHDRVIQNVLQIIGDGFQRTHFAV